MSRAAFENPLTRPSDTLSPSEGERDGVRGWFRDSRRELPREILTRTFLVLIWLNGTARAYAEDQTQPMIRAMIGGLFFDEHSYIAESAVHLPILREGTFGLAYDQYEVTPVLREGAQTQLLTTRNRLTADYSLGDRFRLIGVGGYHRTAFQDRAGSLEAWEIGGGIGSPLRREPGRLDWSVAAGGYPDRERLDADWWADLNATWRVYEFSEGQMLETSFRPFLGLSADVESANDGGRFHALYRVGPVLEVLSANGNRARFRAQWYANDGNPFYEDRFSSMLLGVEVTTSLDQENLFSARDQRPVGWLPVIWGQYDIGYGGDHQLQRTELNAEIHDFKIAEHIFTAVLFYESRQEYRTGDYENASYTISLGAQTVVGLASVLSQGQPLVLGTEYLHRSAHALSPDADRAPPPPDVLPHSSLNLLRARLQTQGWDLPYRDSSIYRGETRWLNDFDWRVTLGYDFHHSRDRANPAAQLGLNWDAASLRGCVAYARGIVSVGNETPDWQIETGVRNRPWKVFFRWESYGLEDQLARGNLAVVGLGFVL
jgi:hypothetical protein